MKLSNVYPVPHNEKLRLASLHSYAILDTISEEEYNAITKIAAQICNMPASLITFLDKKRQWFKSHLGIDMRETPRDLSFCNYTILNPDEILVVPDLRVDERFSNNPLVTGAPNAVFYAGAPLVTPDGFVLGSICVLDAKVNDLNTDQRGALKALAQQVITRLELRKKIKDLKQAQLKLKKANKNLKSFAHIISHDMKTPLANISMVTGAFQNQYSKDLDKNANEYLDLITRSAKELLSFVNDILIQVTKVNKRPAKQKRVNSYKVLSKVIDLVAPTEDIEINVTGQFPSVCMDKTSLQQVFQNLITNAIKYNDKEKGIIKITSSSDESFHYFNIADNGIGIKKENLQKIFREHQTLDETDRFGNKGTGIGLSTIKNIIESAGGKISVSSEKNYGSVFSISIPYMAKTHN